MTSESFYRNVREKWTLTIHADCSAEISIRNAVAMNGDDWEVLSNEVCEIALRFNREPLPLTESRPDGPDGTRPES